MTFVSWLLFLLVANPAVKLYIWNSAVLLIFGAILIYNVIQDIKVAILFDTSLLSCSQLSSTFFLLLSIYQYSINHKNDKHFMLW